MTIDTLYRVTSTIDEWPHRGHVYNDVYVQWVRHDNRFADDDHTAVAPLIKDTEKVRGVDWPYVIGFINELFTKAQADALSLYLLETYNVATTIEPVSFPIEVHNPDGYMYCGASAIPTGGARGAYMLSEADDYTLPFEVYGYYSVQKQWNSMSTGEKPVLRANSSFDRTQFVIFYNNAAVNAPCPICGERTDPQVGPEIGLRDSWRPLCCQCREQHAPELAVMLEFFWKNYSVNPGLL